MVLRTSAPFNLQYVSSAHLPPISSLARSSGSPSGTSLLPTAAGDTGGVACYSTTHHAGLLRGPVRARCVCVPSPTHLTHTPAMMRSPTFTRTPMSRGCVRPMAYTVNPYTQMIGTHTVHAPRSLPAHNHAIREGAQEAHRVTDEALGWPKRVCGGTRSEQPNTVRVLHSHKCVPWLRTGRWPSATHNHNTTT